MIHVFNYRDKNYIYDVGSGSLHECDKATADYLRAKEGEEVDITYLTDEQIAETVRQCYTEIGYLCDPHGACGFRALQENLRPGEYGVFLETAHPAKFKSTVEEIINAPVEIPEKLAAFMKGTKQSVPMAKDFESFKAYLMQQ